MTTTITLTQKEFEALTKSVDGKIAYYERIIAQAKQNGKYRANGLIARQLNTFTDIQKKLEVK
tara:strand:- start:430 stop:618 length:189 start_codon:yes stop_codon:yes gene_type:complete